MKEKLRKVLIDYIDILKNNQDNLKELLNQVEINDKCLDKIKEIYKIFNKDEERNIYNLSELKADDYLYIINDFKKNPDLKDINIFAEEETSFDGLVYIVKGINEKVPLILNYKQIEEINKFINLLEEQTKYYNKEIDELKNNISSLQFDDLEILKSQLEKYNKIIDNIDNNNYINEIEEIIEAMNKNDFLQEDIIELLSYLLKYNAEIYDKNLKQSAKVEKLKEENESLEIEETEEKLDLVLPKNELENDLEETKEIDNKLDSKENDNKDNEVETKSKEETEKLETNLDDEFLDIDLPPYEERKYKYIEEIEKEKQTLVETEDTLEEQETILETKEETKEEKSEEKETVKETKEELNETNETLEDKPQETKIQETEDTLETNEVDKKENNEDNLKSLLKEYDINYDSFNSEEKELLKSGILIDYEDILSYLKENKLLNIFDKDNKKIANILAKSDIETIKKIIYVINNDLSVDSEDAKLTLQTVIDTLPSVFLKDENKTGDIFLDNVAFFKKLKLDLIKIFDNHKEIYLTDTKLLEKNLEIIKEYNIELNENNIKYLLMLDNIDNKIDYFIEAKVHDNNLNKDFNGNDLIKSYPAKLNNVCETTIKRIYQAENKGRKIFGTKENSLAGEITNIKVDIINIDDEFNSRFLNNEFSDINKEKVEEYSKYILGEKDYRENVELEKIKKYINGNRYIINNKYISKPKFENIYNILRSKNVNIDDSIKFALGYNSIILKEDYEILKDVILKEVK